MKNTLLHIQQCEHQIACNDDSIIHKAMQEGLELVESLTSHNLDHIQEELWDALSNILSAYSRITGQYIIDILSTKKQHSLCDIAIALWERNSQIQKYRGIYSRNTIDALKLQHSTEKVISIIQSCVWQRWLTMDIEHLLQLNLKKFENRLSEYKHQINLDEYIHDIPDFPKPWIVFKDISPLLHNPRAFSYAVHTMSVSMKNSDVIVWLDARGFIFWSAIAHLLQKPFVMIRKKWKLPWDCLEDSYTLEYWSNIQIIQKDSIHQWSKVAIIDDLLATGWSMQSAIRLIQSLWAQVQWCHVLIELSDLWARNQLNVDVYSILQYGNTSIK